MPIRPLPRALSAALVATAGLFAANAAGAAERAFIIPPPAVDEPATAAQEKAVIAGGCFWGVQAVFQHVKGVTSAVSGYAGGQAATADYDLSLIHI